MRRSPSVVFIEWRLPADSRRVYIACSVPVVVWPRRLRRPLKRNLYNRRCTTAGRNAEAAPRTPAVLLLTIGAFPKTLF